MTLSSPVQITWGALLAKLGHRRWRAVKLVFGNGKKMNFKRLINSNSHKLLIYDHLLCDLPSIRSLNRADWPSCTAAYVWIRAVQIHLFQLLGVNETRCDWEILHREDDWEKSRHYCNVFWHCGIIVWCCKTVSRFNCRSMIILLPPIWCMFWLYASENCPKNTVYYTLCPQKRGQ